jgi:hypothetical protein
VIELDIATRSGDAVAVIVSLRMVVVLVIRGIATHPLTIAVDVSVSAHHGEGRD